MFKLMTNQIETLLQTAFRKREPLCRETETTAYRVFNGFYEGCPEFCVDRYGESAVILWQSRHLMPDSQTRETLRDCCLKNLPGVQSVLLKNRFAKTEEEKKGVLLAGSRAETTIREWGVDYPLRLSVNKDCGFYLDSSLLRRWLLENAGGKRVLNTFAYTGSLGDAAEAGGALSVTQTDVNPNYLSRKSSRQEYLIGDFFRVSSELRRSGRLFDILILDPPFFALNRRAAKVNPGQDIAALINKIRPLAAHGSRIVVVNNALFLSGADFMEQLQSLCGEYLQIEELIPVPESFYGYGVPAVEGLPADPAPFNHPTKIAVLRVQRKDQRV